MQSIFRPFWKSIGIALFFLFLICGERVQPRSGHAASSAPRVVISGVYFDGYLRGTPEPEEAIRITNTDPRRTVDVGGWALSDRYFVVTRQKGRRKRSRRRRRRRRTFRSRRRRRRSSSNARVYITDPTSKFREIILPAGTRIPPGGSIWIAYQGKAFYRVFGKYPAIEAADTVSNIPDATLRGGWPTLYASRGIVSLHNAYGQPMDVVCFVRDSQTDHLDKSKVPSQHWKGPSVLLRFANTYSWTGQILARDRRANGLPTRDTQTAHDWNSGFSAAQLGQDPTHRVELPGQSFWNFPRLRNVRAEVVATSAPENNFSALSRAFRSARREILINIYKFTNVRLVHPIVAALRRGVKVTVLMEGSPVGGVEERSRAIAQKIERAGGVVYWMRGKRKKKIYRRYRFNHAKYAIIDRTWVIIGSENYGTTGHPVHPSYGNRGWEVHIRSPQVVRWMLKVFREDTAHKRFYDLIRYKDEYRPGFRYGAPKPGFRFRKGIKKGLYSYRKAPLRVRGRMDLKLVFSPDNSLHETQSIIGAILRCKKEVLVAQNSIPLFWGKKHHRSFKKTPTLPLMALLAAARKDCRVRVLTDSVWYNVRAQNPRDNDDSVRVINQIAQKEGLDLQAKVVNLESVQIQKIHTKGIIVDRKEVFVGSINWSENSFKGNREVGILIRHPRVAGYYVDLFMRDWLRTRLFRVIVQQRRVFAYSNPSKRSRRLYTFASGDPVDVLGEVGEFYQVRLPKRKIGFIQKRHQTKVFTPFEARFFVGEVGVVVGRVKKIQRRRNRTMIYFGQPFQRGFYLLAWSRTADKLDKKYGKLERSLIGRTLQIKGRIGAYRKQPQMLLRDLRDFTLLR